MPRCLLETRGQLMGGSVLSHDVGCRDQTHILRLGCKPHYTLSRPTALQVPVPRQLSFRERTGPICSLGMTLRIHGGHKDPASLSPVYSAILLSRFTILFLWAW